jgi:hypothetical protein
MKSLLLLFLPISLLAQSDEVILTGPLEETLFNYSWASEWKLNEKNYQPDPIQIEKLRKVTAGKDLHYKVYLGTWCDDSKKHVPAWFKIDSLLQLKSEYIGVDRSKQCPLTDCSSWNITLLPTIVIYKEDKEIGRIVETPKKSVESDLLEILESPH